MRTKKRTSENAVVTSDVPVDEFLCKSAVGSVNDLSVTLASSTFACAPNFLGRAERSDGDGHNRVGRSHDVAVDVHHCDLDLVLHQGVVLHRRVRLGRVHQLVRSVCDVECQDGRITVATDVRGGDGVLRGVGGDGGSAAASVHKIEQATNEEKKKEKKRRKKKGPKKEKQSSRECVRACVRAYVRTCVRVCVEK